MAYSELIKNFNKTKALAVAPTRVSKIKAAFRKERCFLFWQKRSGGPFRN